ncbi:hypothetical protein A8W25_01205 [Streptomyces sp. ERV7]|uniref:HpcH/HpaI aldolase/citrate lyase family protein n=1 Tax=Streptomyces sp. ERV7 TaxID=1322334 RepID=UPI0007F48D95|nr:CoA ester lyase [Streptomyces sp. ERV7]OAR26939.1 hypothetical protein A8W25_01205 [Streptomyces sp. ERV7]
MDLRKQPRRSIFITPCTNFEMMKRGLDSDADAVVFDLEDSVPDTGKAEARRRAIEMAPNRKPTQALGLRINDWTSPWCYRDLIDVLGTAGEHIDYIVLPKAESAEQVAAVGWILQQIEREASTNHQILVEPCIESATGLLDARSLLAASTRVFSVGYSATGFDLAADLHFDDRVPAAFRDTTALLPLLAARALGLALIDGPHPPLHDAEGLRALATDRFAMGFDGKWAIHPAQVEILNEAFTPTQSALRRAVSTLESYDEAAQRGRGAAVVDGSMVDIASLRVAQRTLASAPAKTTPQAQQSGASMRDTGGR